ncbi:hypothetical protein [Brevibacillus sp. NRS-1366]|uniref:hypothetical protein n=1 Tax=Brevibacillus sp. NRS-1366 TaxID=3233899 RepID=UPI003D1E418F
MPNSNSSYRITAKFNEPSGICIDAKGNLYVSDTGNQRIRYIDLNHLLKPASV